MRNNKEWRENGEHLPEFMRDFHDQKEIFRTMYGFFNNIEECPVNIRDGHIYVIDWFLWFMAIHGYKLTKTTAKVERYDLDETISEFDPRKQNRLTKEQK